MHPLVHPSILGCCFPMRCISSSPTSRLWPIFIFPSSPSISLISCLKVFPSASPLICRHSAGERSLAEEAPPVVSAAHPPGRLLLLTGRHASCAGTVGPLPQRGHQKELHSVNLGAFHGRARGQHDAEWLTATWNTTRADRCCCSCTRTFSSGRRCHRLLDWWRGRTVEHQPFIYFQFVEVWVQVCCSTAAEPYKVSFLWKRDIYLTF